MKIFLPLIAVATALALSNCSSSSPTSRIEKHAEIYSELSVRDQELVSQGQIAEGMSPGGVFLALGDPDRQVEGSAEGKRTMRWDYTSLYPIYTNSFYGGFGYGGYGGYGRGFGGYGGGYGRHGGRYGGFGFGPQVSYIPGRSSTVWFENERVRSFERVR